MKFLIIEDDLGIRTVLRRFLTPLGIPIEEAGTWMDALILMRKVPPPDVVFLDIKLPDTVGMDAETILRQNIARIKECNMHAIVIVMTGDSSETAIRAAAMAGADAFQHKLEMDSQSRLWNAMKGALESRRERPGCGLVKSGQELLEKLVGLLGI